MGTYASASLTTRSRCWTAASGAEGCGSGSGRESETEHSRPCDTKINGLQNDMLLVGSLCSDPLTFVATAATDSSCPAQGLVCPTPSSNRSTLRISERRSDPGTLGSPPSERRFVARIPGARVTTRWNSVQLHRRPMRFVPPVERRKGWIYL